MSIDSISSDQLVPVGRDLTLAEHAYQQLKRGLITGSFQPGQKITGRLVADALGVSLTPAREAISRLIAEDALEAVGPRTICVPVLSPETFDEITKIRLVVEGYASEEATAHLTDADSRHLERLQDQINSALDRSEYRRALEVNRDFHYRIYNACRLPRLVSYIESLWLQVGPTLNYLYPDYQVRRVGVSHHKEAIAAIKSKNAKALGAAMRADIRDGYARLSEALHHRDVG